LFRLRDRPGMGRRRMGWELVVSPAAPSLVAVALLTSAAGWAEDRFDHQGALGLLVSGGAGDKATLRYSNRPADTGARYPIDVGASYPLGYSGNDLLLMGELALPPHGGPADAAVWGGYRRYFGRERVKTYLDLMGAAHLTPDVTFGPRLGLGVQYEWTSIFGTYLGINGEIGVGQVLRFSAQIALGIQLRSYLLE